MVSGPQWARAVIELNPLRLGYSVFSDKNPMMRVVGPMAEQVKAERSPASADNPFLAMQQKFSSAMVQALNMFRDMREEHVERSFHTIYGSPLVQAWCGISQNDAPPRPRPGLSPSVLMAAEKEKSRLKGRIAEGNALDAAAPARGFFGQGPHPASEGRSAAS